VAAGCSVTLAVHALYSSTVAGFRYDLPDINWGEYVMACCCALLSATAAADTPTRLPAPRPPGLDLLRVPRLAYAALAGLIAAAGYAFVGVTRLALPWSLGTYLAWAVLPVLPIAALATAVGLLTHHQPNHTDRVEEPGRRRVVPVEGIATASLGMIMVQIPLMGADHPIIWNTLLILTGPDTAQTLETLSGHLGAAGIAAGAALTAATTLRARLLAVPTAALLGVLIPPFGLTAAFGLTFVAAVLFWWALRTARVLVALQARWRQPHPRPPAGPPPTPGAPPAPQYLASQPGTRPSPATRAAIGGSYGH
jgi:hypothetical protein